MAREFMDVSNADTFVPRERSPADAAPNRDSRAGRLSLERADGERACLRAEQVKAAPVQVVQLLIEKGGRVRERRKIKSIRKSTLQLLFLLMGATELTEDNKDTMGFPREIVSDYYKLCEYIHYDHSASAAA